MIEKSMIDARRTFAAEAALHSSIGLLGACVSLDMRTALFPAAKKFRYMLRIGTVSMMSGAPSKIDLSSVIRNEKELLTFDRDANKTFDFEALAAEKFILMDFYRDTYPTVLLSDGRYITAGLQYYNYKLEGVLPVQKVIRATSLDYLDLWLEAFMRFAEEANRSSALWIISPIYQIPYQRNGWENIIPEKSSSVVVNKKNVILAHMQRIALAKIHNSCLLPIPFDDLELDPKHQFGLGPYHFVKDYFRSVRQMIEINPGSISAFDGDDAARERAVAFEIDGWRRHAARF